MSYFEKLLDNFVGFAKVKGMKGLHLLVRPAEEADENSIRVLLATGQQPYEIDPDSIDFVGKLIGEHVAAARWRRSKGDLELESLFVAPHLRGRRIGTVLVRGIARWSESNEVTRLTVRKNVLPDSFLQRIGFQQVDDLFIKVI